MDDIIEAFVEIGYKKEDIDKQLSKLTELVEKSIYVNLISSHSDLKGISNQEDITNWIKDNLTDDEKKNAVDQALEDIVIPFVKAVGSNLSSQKKEDFFALLSRSISDNV